MQIKKLPTEALHRLPIVLDASTLKARWWTFTQGRIRKRTLFTTWCQFRFLVFWLLPMKLSLQVTCQAA